MTYNEFLKTKFSDGLNDGQLSFFREFLSSQRNIFLTGGAGVGKSFVLSRFSDFCESEGIYLNKCSSTDVAAININSQTLHSYLGVGLGDGSIDVVVGKVRKNKLARKRLQNCSLIFIDEISMISGEFLDKFYAIIFPDDCLIVYAKNIEVDEHNLSELRKLPGAARSYRAFDVAPDYLINTLDKCCLAPVNLALKIGAKVMLLKNDIDNGLSNGSIGVVTSLHDDGVQVKFDCGTFMVVKHQWKIEESVLTDDGKIKTKTLASREQIPLRLAYAATMHKTQGLTVDKIGVDLNGCFAPGQMYVSLSRSRDLNGLSIQGLNYSSLKVDPRCINFYNMLS